ncbi:NADH-quinone oxidoreductase subunit J [soil metagenome]
MGAGANPGRTGRLNGAGVVELVVFVLMGGGALAGAVTVIKARNPVYAAMGLLGTLFAMAVLSVMQLAHFVAAVQVIVYAGAVMTLFLFVIMLVGVDKHEDTRETIPYQRRLALALGLIAVGIVVVLMARGRFAWVPLATEAADIQTTNGTVQALAEPMFTEWVLAFEATALLLTIAAAGTIALASFRRPLADTAAEKAGL